MIDRRELFRWTGAAGASFLFSHALGGCGGEDSPPPLPRDPEGRWWLSGNYAPVGDELEALDLEIEGALPPELDGLFVRNGANPASGESAHWFLGDGMLHGVRLQGGRALWYRNRYVQTLALQSGSSNIAANVANTAIKLHAGKLLALYEVGVPHEIAADDLSTVGEYDFAGQLGRPMSAHPKIDPLTGEMFFIGYAPFEPYLTYHVVDAQGRLTRSVELAIEHPAMMHDFQITESYALLFDFPVHFVPELLAEGFPFKWVDDAPSRIGLIPRDGSATEPSWIEVDACFMFHSYNAYEDGDGKVILEGCRLPSLWKESASVADQAPAPWRWELDPDRGSASEGRLHDLSGDFPQIDLRVAGRPHRVDYSLRFDESGGSEVARPDGISKFDRASGALAVWDSGAGHQPDEALFVPFGSAEDAGYLLSVVFDRTTARSYVAVLDATRVEAGPVAKVHLPRRVPFGFHGTWVPASPG